MSLQSIQENAAATLPPKPLPEPPCCELPAPPLPDPERRAVAKEEAEVLEEVAESAVEETPEENERITVVELLRRGRKGSCGGGR